MPSIEEVVVVSSRSGTRIAYKVAMPKQIYGESIRDIKVDS